MKIAVIAHDGKKADMVSFVMKRLDFFKKDDVELVGTGTTGTMIQNAGLEVDLVASGPMGGDAQIGAMVTEGKVDCVLFFRDPLDKHPHDVDISMLMRLCDVHTIPLATNYKSAHILIKYFKNKI
jgi:methylglyoxal synthase|tara:strand:+ start:144 stop:518 length:375 start_codon:yes stop_codon:yes gene_type:complete